MHYISNEWQLGKLVSGIFKWYQTARPSLISLHLPEELLIDFRELIGEHSGENLAHAVDETEEMYGLKGRVSGTSFVLETIADVSVGCCYQLR
jgi:hypothetical protein